jgi:phosphatidylserine/phosphatidylglycerophosphate/cardiolipin synthase-like enzyme
MIDSAHAIAHNKVMILDGKTVITGSFNFTKAAEEKNAENLLTIKDKDLAGKYIENWKNPYQKAIIVSGFSETERVTKAQELGAGAYVKKPYVLQKLGLAIGKELDRSIGSVLSKT